MDQEHAVTFDESQITNGRSGSVKQNSWDRTKLPFQKDYTLFWKDHALFKSTGTGKEKIYVENPLSVSSDFLREYNSVYNDENPIREIVVTIKNKSKHPIALESFTYGEQQYKNDDPSMHHVHVPTQHSSHASLTIDGNSESKEIKLIVEEKPRLVEARKKDPWDTIALNVPVCRDVANGFVFLPLMVDLKTGVSVSKMAYDAKMFMEQNGHKEYMTTEKGVKLYPVKQEGWKIRWNELREEEDWENRCIKLNFKPLHGNKDDYAQLVVDVVFKITYALNTPKWRKPVLTAAVQMLEEEMKEETDKVEDALPIFIPVAKVDSDNKVGWFQSHHVFQRKTSFKKFQEGVLALPDHTFVPTTNYRTQLIENYYRKTVAYYAARAEVFDAGQSGSVKDLIIPAINFPKYMMADGSITVETPVTIIMLLLQLLTAVTVPDDKNKVLLESSVVRRLANNYTTNSLKIDSADENTESKMLTNPLEFLCSLFDSDEALHAACERMMAKKVRVTKKVKVPKRKY